MEPILQKVFPFDVHAVRPLPGVAPLGADDWLMVDDAFAGQMARRAQLIEEKPGEVLALLPQAWAAAGEVLAMALDIFRRDPGRGYRFEGDAVVRPDGVRVVPDMDDPLRTLGHLVQEDVCILQREGDEHVLTGAVLCFPASWRLDEKIGRPLVAIHEPVAHYDDTMARRVQRLFDGVQARRPMWRFNRLWYQDPELHAPRSVHAPRRQGAGASDGPYLRSEKQSILRLPESGAVVFTIHTFMVARADVPEAAQKSP
ncbi:MAG: DUF3445 domain-containing protein [Rhodobacteraceae bacterium]|nr:MAG: DUF3445 domain-containing protein [Paracoccaceae bacterium]